MISIFLSSLLIAQHLPATDNSEDERTKYYVPTYLGIYYTRSNTEPGRLPRSNIHPTRQWIIDYFYSSAIKDRRTYYYTHYDGQTAREVSISGTLGCLCNIKLGGRIQQYWGLYLERYGNTDWDRERTRYQLSISYYVNREGNCNINGQSTAASFLNDLQAEVSPIWNPSGFPVPPYLVGKYEGSLSLGYTGSGRHPVCAGYYLQPKENCPNVRIRGLPFLQGTYKCTNTKVMGDYAVTQVRKKRLIKEKKAIAHLSPRSNL